ncbi:MAG: hypothetical protein OXF62_08085 [Caldilineaceae bacterium]|nr:hypothetical protein [Caldilineaceae bacterium]
MAAIEPPDKQGKGKSQKRRYFRRRKRRGSSAQTADYANEQNDGRDDERRAPRARPKNQNSKRSDNRRRSSRRRNSTARAAAKIENFAAEEALPPTDVYIYTHVIRPAYKDAGSGDYHADHSLNLSGATVGAALPVGMDYLLESIGQQLDEWFNRPAGAIKPDNNAAETDGPGTVPDMVLDMVPDADSDDETGPPLDQPERADGSRAADGDDSPEGATLSGPKD